MNEPERTYLKSLRPHVGELRYFLFGRAVHPELFDSRQTRRFERGKYQVRIDLLPAGHVIAWTFDGVLTMTEIITTANAPLPRNRSLATSPLRVRGHQDIHWRRGIHYQTTMQVESARPELLWDYQQQLTDVGNQGMVLVFGSQRRLSVGGMSYVHVETRSRSVMIQSVHTFPEDEALLKLETIYQTP